MSDERAARRSRAIGELLGIRGSAAVEICGLSADSRRVAPGYLFAALPGARTDGRRFIGQALESGAVAVLMPEDAAANDADTKTAVVIKDRAPRRRFAELAAHFFGNQPETVAAVTGTNGKTSVASFTRQLWQMARRSTASIGTLGVESDALSQEGVLTSPDPVALHENLAELAAAGVTHAVCEASSHGLAQHRLDGVRLAAGAFTNLSREHLDYHGTPEAYFHAKARLFGDLLPAGSPAVIDIDGEWGRRMAELAVGRGLRLLSAGYAGAADLRLEAVAAEGDKQRLRITYEGRFFETLLPLAGAFQAKNALLAAGLVIALGGDAEAVLGDLARLQAVPGRLEKVGETGSGGSVFIDYAHTPDALANLLEALRPHSTGRLVVVFGCGGDRDRGKRPEMGRIAAEQADEVIVTDDNPRSENAAAIRSEILMAAPMAREIGDRAAAIAEAAAGLAAGDILVLAGKGHERGQIVGEEVRPFSDLEVARAAIAAGGKS